MLYFFASRGLEMVTGLPLTRISPEFGGWAPDSAFMSGDFPAPLPPTRPMTSPAWRSTETSSTACTPPKETLMWRISTIGICSATATSSPALLAAASTAAVGIEADGQDEHDAGHDVLDRRVVARVCQSVSERLHDERAEDCARDGANAARERSPGHARGSDHVQ